MSFFRTWLQGQFRADARLRHYRSLTLVDFAGFRRYQSLSRRCPILILELNACQN